MQEVVAEFHQTHCVFEAWGLENRSIDDFFRRVRAHKKEFPDFVCFANMAHESLRLQSDSLEFFQKLSEECPRTVVFFDSGSRIHNEPRHGYLESLGFRILYVDYFLYLCYYHLTQRGLRVNATWNPDASSFLFLTGKYYKLNRAKLLYKFSQASLLDRCEWSLPYNDEIPETLNRAIPELSDQEFRTFMINHVRDIDLPKQEPGHMDFDLALGIPYDPDMYQRNLFRVIAETRFGPAEKTDTFFTEKTWLTIINKVPFILAADQNSLWALEQMGFRTFREYLPVPEYDQIKEDTLRLDAIVTNAEHWINHMHNKDQIQCDIEHNFELFKQLGHGCEQNIQEFLDQLGIGIKTPEIFQILQHNQTSPEKYND